MTQPSSAVTVAASQATLTRLENDITELAAHIAAAKYRLVELIYRYDKLCGWQAGGHRSLAHWLNWRCGMGMNSARETVRVARALPELPLISAAFKVGQLSFSKVRALTRVALPTNEATLLKLARAGTASHLERICRGYRRAHSLKTANAVHEGRKLSCYFTADGGLVIRGLLPPEVGAAFMQALDKAKDSDADGDEAAANRADALGRIAESFLAHGDQPQKGGERHVVNVVVNPETLRDSANAENTQHACLSDGDACLSTETARRLACDASLVAVYESAEGEPLSIGRKTRVIPPAMLRALRRRDKGCRFPGCTHDQYVDAHHIQHWANGGETSLENLALLCRRHHRLIHEGGFVLLKVDSKLEFCSPNGKIIPASADNAASPRYRGNVFQLYSDNAPHDINKRTLTPSWQGETLDLHYVVSLIPEPSI